MEFRPFGRTGLKVSAIGFGCWEIDGTYGHIDEAQFQRAVHAAIESGITCFDTAEAYGMGYRRKHWRGRSVAAAAMSSSRRNSG